MAAKQKPILYNGMGQPYLALFDFRGMPIMNQITGIPLGAYISTWNYRYDEEKENLATITFDTGDPDTVDIDAQMVNSYQVQLKPLRSGTLRQSLILLVLM